jgi:penicillin-binding protein 2
MHEAIKNSCDIYFYQTALKIGPDAIASAARAMGFGSVFDIGIPGQKKGRPRARPGRSGPTRRIRPTRSGFRARPPATASGRGP